MDKEAKIFFENFIGKKSTDFITLPQSGSSRKNFIGIDGNQKFVITQNEDIRENEAFFYFSDVFKAKNLNTPTIFSISENRVLYVQEFLGAKTLSEIITEEGLSERVRNLVKQTLIKLYELQQATLQDVDYNKTFEYQAYDEIPVSHDLFYFKFMFADVVGLHYHKTSLLNEFKKIEKIIESLEPKGLMIRDFQSRNIMVNNEDEVYFIDYQSAMFGPLMYDVISFLYQAKANFPEAFREEMLNFYYSLWNNKQVEENLKQSLQPLQLIRYLQVLGVYGFRGLVQRKSHFISSIEQGIENIVQFSKTWSQMNEFPELNNLISQLNSEKTKENIKTYLK